MCSFPDLMNKLEALESSGGNHILQAPHSPEKPDERLLLPIHDASRIGAGILKRDKAPSLRRSSLNSSASGQPMRKKARKDRFTATQNDVLETWLVCHTGYPYPQRQEKEDLAAATGLTVGQIQSWFARTRQRKLRPQNDDFLNQWVVGGGLQARATRAQHSSPDNRRASRSRGGSSAKLSVGPGLSSLAVAPASPKPDTSDEKSDCDLWSFPFQDSVSNHSYLELSVLSSGVSKVDWWLGTLPEKTSEYDSGLALIRDYFSLGKIQSPVTGSVYSSNSPDRKVASSQMLAPSSNFNSSGGYQFSPVPPPKPRDTISVSSSSLGSNVLSSRQSSWNSGNLSIASVKTFATSRTSYSFSRRRGRRMTAKRRSPSPKLVGARHRRSRSPSPRVPKRRHKNSGSPSPKAANLPQWSEEWKYCCTFCTERFRDRYRWRRHEESKHAPQKSWICKPVKPFQDRPPLCPLCHFGEGHPVQCLHDMQPCWSKPEIDRTLYRKDNLVQHLEGVHNARAGISSDLIDELTEGISCVPYDLTCHFCEHQSATWQNRVSHIAVHFEWGMKMADWKAPEAESGNKLAMSQINPYIPRLSRLWAIDEKDQLVDFQHKLQLRSQSPILESHHSYLLRILIEDYSAMGKDQIA